MKRCSQHPFKQNYDGRHNFAKPIAGKIMESKKKEKNEGNELAKSDETTPIRHWRIGVGFSKRLNYFDYETRRRRVFLGTLLSVTARAEQKNSRFLFGGPKTHAAKRGL